MSVKRVWFACVLVSSFIATVASAGSVRHDRRPHIAPQTLDRTTARRVVADDGRANVIIILKDDPAVFSYASTLGAGGRGTMAQTSANQAARDVIDKLTSAQSAFTSALKSAGVQFDELYRVQRVLNGIAVRMKPSDVQRVRTMPNVKRVAFLPVYQRPDNIVSVPFINAPQVWAGADVGGLGLAFNATGKGVKIGDIDTGLDYIHPDFGGTGNLADYEDIDPTSVIGKNSHNVLFPTTKVVGGKDFAGDDYDANASAVPQPDPNPMDCNNHGTHTAGTIAGVGVNNDGSPFTGAYNTTAPYSGDLRIGPGVAPQADLYALRIFGCAGATSLVAAAIDWAADPNQNGDLSDHLDVVNMSLGTPFGVDTGNNIDIEAINNAALAGVLAVSAAGNSGDAFFIAGSPAAANLGIAVAASVDNGQVSGVLDVTGPTPATYVGELPAYTNANGIPVPHPSGQNGKIVLVNDGTALATQGCGSTYVNAADVAGNIALIDRGTCSFIQKAQNAQANGAIAIVVANNLGGDTIINMTGSGADPAITIPGIGVSTNIGNALKADDMPSGTELTETQTVLADTLASFSSRGPVIDANGSIELKPDVAAPGQNIASAQNGNTATGFIPGGQALLDSGTSMATPHVAGMVALLRQINPTASVEQLKAMAINGARHDLFSGNSFTPPRFGASRVGAGRIDAAVSATSTVLAYNADASGAVNLTFDLEPVGVVHLTHNVTLQNLTAEAQSVVLSFDSILDAPGVSFSAPKEYISIPPNGTTIVAVALDADTSAMTRYEDPTLATIQSSQILGGYGFARQYLAEKSAILQVLDSSSHAELARLSVYTAIRPHSSMSTSADLGSAAPLAGTTALTLTGQDVCTGTITDGIDGPTCSVSASPDAMSVGEESFVSPFELQFIGKYDPSLPGYDNVHYVGINSAPDGTTTDYYFAIAAYGKWGSPTVVNYDVCIDTDGDGLFDKIVANTDLGSLDVITGIANATSNDSFISMVYDNVTNNIFFSFVPDFLTADMGDAGVLANNTIILPAAGSDLSLAPNVTKIHYGIAVCPGYILCGAADWPVNSQGTANCGVPGIAIASFNGPFTYDAVTPGVDGTGQALLEDLNGGTLAVDYNVGNLVANGSLGMLLLHSHNTSSTSAEVVILDRVFTDGFDGN